MKTEIDFSAVEALVLKTRELFGNKEKKSEITVKGQDDFVTAVDFDVQKFMQDF